MISVCMSAYNGEKYIKMQIASILFQLCNDDEIVIYDDCSTDKTINIINSFNDKRIKLIYGETNVGFLKGFQNAIENAGGEYIFLSDQDDVWCYDKVLKIMDVFKRTNCDCVVHDAIVVNDNMEILSESLYWQNGISVNPIRNFVKNTFTGACMAFRANTLDNVLPIPENVVFHDRWIGINFGIWGYKVIPISEKLIYYVRHKGTVTDLNRNGMLFIIRDRLRLFYEIIKRYVKHKYSHI